MHPWIERKNLVIESRYADGNPERLDVIAVEPVRLPVDVLVTAGVPPTLVLMSFSLAPTFTALTAYPGMAVRPLYRRGGVFATS